MCLIGMCILLSWKHLKFNRCWKKASGASFIWLKQKLLRNEDCCKSSFQEKLYVMKKVESWLQAGPSETNLSLFVSPAYFLSHNLLPWKTNNFPLFCHLFENVIAPSSNYSFQLTIMDFPPYVCILYGLTNSVFLLLIRFLSILFIGLTKTMKLWIYGIKLLNLW